MGVEMERVMITAADFNGESWDGSPFSAFPDWLRDAVQNGKVDVKPDDRDYALWSVLTPAGRVVAEPGDFIARASDGSLSVDRAPTH